MLAYLDLELRRALRDRRFLLLVVGWPAAAYLLFSAVFGSDPGSQGLQPTVEIMVAMAAFGAIGAVLQSTGPRLALERQNGWLRQLSLTPLDRRQVLLARVIASMTLTLPAICLTLILAAAVHGVRLDASQWVLLALVIGAGCLPFAVIGMVLGCIADGDVAQGVTMVAYLAITALGGLWMPVSILPRAMQDVAYALPSYHLGELGWSIAAGRPLQVVDVLVLLAWLAGAALLAGAFSRRLVARA
ncbi:MAG TPA: ABC transporter permease [Candidatus Binatia bacterium]|nr:ABC transporter permease [Candidatus Binatia bacterium]